MKIEELITSYEAQQRKRERFESRERFLQRCIDDIETDFHKQYGQFQDEWDTTLDACYLFLDQLEAYVCTRDLVGYECQHMFGAIETAETKYQIAKSKKRCHEILIAWQVNDVETLDEFDGHIASIRSVYKMIAVQEEC